MVVAQEQRWCPSDPLARAPAPPEQEGSRGMRQSVDHCRACAAPGDEKQLTEIRHDLSPSGVAACKARCLVAVGCRLKRAWRRRTAKDVGSQESRSSRRQSAIARARPVPSEVQGSIEDAREGNARRRSPTKDPLGCDAALHAMQCGHFRCSLAKIARRVLYRPRAMRSKTKHSNLKFARPLLRSGNNRRRILAQIACEFFGCYFLRSVTSCETCPARRHRRPCAPHCWAGAPALRPASWL